MNQQTKYLFFSHKIFNELAETHDLHCVSIFIPTGRAGMEVDQGQPQIKLKNCLKEIREGLEESELSPTEIKNFLRPVTNLLEDIQFWRNQSDGLAIFLSKNEFRHYSLPLDFEPLTYLSDHFYLKPLLPFFTGDGKFFILHLNKEFVKLFECYRHQINDLHLEDHVPEDIREVVGLDYEQKSLQFRSQGERQSDAIFHGHGEGKDDDQQEFIQYIQAIDEGVHEFLKDERSPLILAGPEEHFGLYRKFSNYSNIFKKHLQPELKTDPMELHQMAWELIGDHFTKRRESRIEYFLNLTDSGRISIEPEKIIPSAVDGRIETLFISKSNEIYGLYDEENRTVIIDQKKNLRNASLVNLSAVHSITQGAEVYLLEAAEMPVKGTILNAIYRY